MAKIKIYRLYNETESITGTGRDLENMGFDTSGLIVSLHNGHKFRGYSCEVIGTTTKRTVNPEKKVTSQKKLDEVIAELREKGMTYAEMQQQETYKLMWAGGRG